MDTAHNTAVSRCSKSVRTVDMIPEEIIAQLESAPSKVTADIERLAMLDEVIRQYAGVKSYATIASATGFKMGFVRNRHLKLRDEGML